MVTVAAQCCDKMDQLEAAHQALRNQVISFIADLTVIGGGRVEFDKPVELFENRDVSGVRLFMAGDQGVPFLAVEQWSPGTEKYVFVLPTLRTKTLLSVARGAVCSVLGEKFTPDELLERMEKISWISLTK